MQDNHRIVSIHPDEVAHVRFGSKADMCSAQAHVRFTPNSDRESGIPAKSCLLYPQSRTCAVQEGMSALGQKRTHALQQKGSLFDHFVGAAD